MQSFNELELPEFEVFSKEVTEDTAIYCVKPAKDPECCTNCGSIDIVKYGSYDRMIRDLPSFGKAVLIKIYTNRYLCKDCGVTFVTDFKSVDSKAKITNRMREAIEKRSLRDTLTKIATDTGVTNTTVSRIAEDYYKKLDSEHPIVAPTVLGIDEAHLDKKMCAVFVDVEHHGIFEMLEKRDKNTVTDFLKKLPGTNKTTVVTMDMWRPYREAVRESIPWAHVVIDKFHVIQVITNALETERKKVSSALEKKPRINLKNSRFLMLANNEDLTPEKLNELNNLLLKHEALRTPYELKERFRDIYRSRSRDEAMYKFEMWKRDVPGDMDSFNDAINTVQNWYDDIFNYFDFPYTNGCVEACNGVIKSIEKMGRGYSFKNIRARVLYGTSATKQPKYRKITKDSVKPLDGMSMITHWSGLETRVEVECGMLTDIYELQKCLDTEF